MEQQAGAPLGFRSRPPSCLGLLDDEKVDSDNVERVFRYEALDLQGRLREQLAQVRTELGLFLRLMYKNKNQHRRTLYYQRLSEVRRDMQMLSKSGLDETVESFAKFFTAKAADGVSAKAATQSKFKDAVDESKALRTFLSVARLLNQSDGPIMAASAQLAGLLRQSFFMPFALTMLSCLARFRVLLIQVLYEVVAAFNLLSTVWRTKQNSLIYSLQGKSVSASALGRSLPAELECRWDGEKLTMTEKKAASVPDNPRAEAALPTEPSPLWFVDDRTGVKCDLPVPAALAGPFHEQPGVNSQVPLNASEGKITIPEVEKTANSGPSLEARPDVSIQNPLGDAAVPSGEDFTFSGEDSDRGNDMSASTLAFDLPAKPPVIHREVMDITELREPLSKGPASAAMTLSRPGFGTGSARTKSVAYRSISHKITPDTPSTTKVVPNSQIGAKSVDAADTGLGHEDNSKPLKVVNSNHTITKTSNQGDDPLPGSIVLEVADSGVPNEQLKAGELNQQSTVQSHSLDYTQTDAAAGTSGSVPSEGAQDALRESVETESLIEGFVCAQITNSDQRATSEHNGTRYSLERLVASAQNEAPVVISLCDDASRDSVRDKCREVASEGVALEQNGSSNLALNKSLLPHLLLSQSGLTGSNAAVLRLRDEVGEEPNPVGEDAMLVDIFVGKDERRSAAPDSSAVHSSDGFNPVSPEIQEADASPSGLRLPGDSARKAPGTCMSAEPYISPLSKGKEDTAGEVQEVFRLDGNGGQLLEGVRERSLGGIERASTTTYQHGAKRGRGVPVAYGSIRSELKASRNRKASDDSKRPETASCQPLPRSGRQKSPAKPKPKSKRGNGESNDRSTESESKRKKTNDIFAMLLGGSD